MEVALERGDLLSYLHDEGYDINEEKDINIQALNIAIALHDESMVSALIDRGVNVEDEVCG